MARLHGILQQNTGVQGKLFLQLEGGDACRNLRECNTKISYLEGLTQSQIC